MVIVPIEAGPPGMPFTVHATAEDDTPPKSAWNWRVPPGASAAVVGLTVHAEVMATTVNGLEEALPSGEVTTIAPVVAPAGTDVVTRFLVEDDTVAAVPLKVTVLELGVSLKPLPKISTSLPAVSVSA